MELFVEFIVNNIIYYIEIDIEVNGNIAYISKQLLSKKENIARKRSIEIINDTENATMFKLWELDETWSEDFKNISLFFDNIIIINSKNEDLHFVKTVNVSMGDSLIKQLSDSDMGEAYDIFSKDDYIINDYVKFEREIAIFQKVVQISLKPNLKNIKIKSDEVVYQNGISYIIRDIILDYGYDLSLRKESSGVQRIFEVCNRILKGLNDGKLVIVDELDIYLHNDLIGVIINFALYYSSGQFIFTTHDLLALKTLESMDNTILIMDNNNNLVSPAKGGNNSIFNKYINGKYDNTEYAVNLSRIFRSLNGK